MTATKNLRVGSRVHARGLGELVLRVSRVDGSDVTAEEVSGCFGEYTLPAADVFSATPSVRFDTSAYRSSHGAEPRGRGSWGFVMGKLDYELVDEKDAQGRARLWFAPGSMTFGEAKKLARAEARARGVSLVGVAS